MENLYLHPKKLPFLVVGLAFNSRTVAFSGKAAVAPKDSRPGEKAEDSCWIG